MIPRLERRGNLFNRSWYNRAGVERVMGAARDESALLWRMRQTEFVLSIVCFLGVAFLGGSRASSSPSGWP
jgi:polyphosphate kinase 2 (PPK2 family)